MIPRFQSRKLRKKPGEDFTESQAVAIHLKGNSQMIRSDKITQNGEKQHRYGHASALIHSSFKTPMTGRLRYSPR